MDFPFEIYEIIFNKLNFHSFIKMSLVNKDYHEIVKNVNYYKQIEFNSEISEHHVQALVTRIINNKFYNVHNFKRTRNVNIHAIALSISKSHVLELTWDELKYLNVRTNKFNCKYLKIIGRCSGYDLESFPNLKYWQNIDVCFHDNRNYYYRNESSQTVPYMNEFIDNLDNCKNLCIRISTNNLVNNLLHKFIDNYFRKDSEHFNEKGNKILKSKNLNVLYQPYCRHNRCPGTYKKININDPIAEILQEIRCIKCEEENLLAFEENDDGGNVMIPATPVINIVPIINDAYPKPVVTLWVPSLLDEDEEAHEM